MQTRSDKHHAILSAELTSDLRKDGKSAGLGVCEENRMSR